MKFLDANVFIYAFYKPKKELVEREMKKKEEAKKIIQEVNSKNEKVITSVVHLSEIVNILKHGTSLENTSKIISTLIQLENCIVVGVSRDDYQKATGECVKHQMDSNDCLAYEIMRKNKINEIYTFDKHFRNLKGIKTLPEIGDENE